MERRSLFAKFISNLYTKRLSPNSYQESVRYTSTTLCAVGTSVILHYLHPLRDSVCLLYKTFSLSLHISEEPLITLLPCLEYPVTVSLITLLPCLTLLCYHVSHYSVPCLEYPVTMSLITLYHLSHYPVTISLITLLPCLTLPCLIKECKTTKKS